MERFLHTSYDQFAGRAVIASYLPLLAERFARQRLRAGPHRGQGRQCPRLVRRHRARRADQRGRRGGDARARHRRHRRVPQALDQRDRPGCRRGGHHGPR
ncbi:three-helix bundle dimerization domain-containing protein [Nonomuraea sp. PA05]|uniref:three-helix bundle dimerization domain-containing protein n=1 Tax=Nonomuraea sp. PA05 TaxID=2604466 RepID=UPI0039834708